MARSLTLPRWATELSSHRLALSMGSAVLLHAKAFPAFDQMPGLLGMRPVFGAISATAPRSGSPALADRSNSAGHPPRQSRSRCRPWAGPKDGIGIVSPNASALTRAAWWHNPQVTESDRTPFSRMFASVIGSTESLKRAPAIVLPCASPYVASRPMFGGMFTSRDNPADFSVVVKRRGKPPEPWRWEIHRAGRSTAVVLAPKCYPTVRAAQKAGKEAIAGMFRKHRIIE
jgi:hypothetical protein